MSAAVIIGLCNDKILLTLRSIHLRSFSGDPCFPGGKLELDDVSIYHAALREFHEEVDFVGTITPIGALLPICAASSTQQIYPFIVRLDGEVGGFNSDEVSQLLWLDWARLVPDSFTINQRLPLILHNRIIQSNEGATIWGVTASMLHSLTYIKQYI